MSDDWFFGYNIRMRIALDARFIGTPGGIGRYVRELYRAMAAAGGENEFVLFLREAGMRAVGDEVEKIRAEVRWYTLREQLVMPGIARRARADLVHWPHWNVPLRSPRPFVVTIHDLIMLDYPSVRATTLGPLAFKFKNAGFKRVLKNAIMNSAAILTPSEYVKRRIEETFGITDARITVTGEGVSTLPPPAGDFEELLYRRGVRPPYVLALGNAYPHKNLSGLLEAFVLVRRKLPDLNLVIAGYDDYFFKRLRAETRAGGRGQGVVFVPSPSDLEVAALYGAASVYAIPSYIEGFGLTPLEAMAHGVPVVASRGGSLPEVLGAAAEFVDPTSPEDMARGLISVLTDQNHRAALTAAGQERVKLWTWEKAAAKTLSVYRNVLEV